MLSAAWGSPLIVDGKVYVGDEDGDVAIFRHSADPKVAMKDDGGEMKPFYGEINMGNSVYSTPIVAGNVLYIANRTHLFAIATKGNEIHHRGHGGHGEEDKESGIQDRRTTPRDSSLAPLLLASPCPTSVPCISVLSVSLWLIFLLKRQR